MQIVEYLRLILWLATGAVDVFDPHQKLIASCCGNQRRIGMAQMQRAGGRGCKARYPSHWVKDSLARSV